MTTTIPNSDTAHEDPHEARHHSLNPSDRRAFIPAIGLKEYWYPGISDRKVGRHKPEMVKMLGEELCFFRGKDGKVAALTNVCPHRGAQLGLGHCDFRGTVSCPYHGFVYDQNGECLAVLGEGPDSKMPGKIRARTYPTRTLKGLVFVWMGEGEPAPIEEDVPEEFFKPAALVLHDSSTWSCNWRPALENIYDAHVPYVHRDSILFLMNSFGPPRRQGWARPVRVGGALQQAFGRRPAPGGVNASGQPQPKPDPRAYYPALNGYWPKHNYRRLWSWIFAYTKRLGPQTKVDIQNPEWRSGQHLPSMLSIDYPKHMYRRVAVPVDEKTTRVWYYHYAERPSTLARIYEIIWYKLIHSYLMNHNFSGQDYSVVGPQYYDQPEKLSVSDLQAIEWRKFLMSARGMNLPAERVAEVWEEEQIAEADAAAQQRPVQAEPSQPAHPSRPAEEAVAAGDD